MSIKLSTKKSNFKKEIAAYVKSGGKVKLLPKQNDDFIDDFIIENSFKERYETYNSLYKSFSNLSNFIVSASIYKPDPPHTSVSFNIKYLVITDVFGEFKSYNAKIEIDENTQNLVGVEAKIDVASLTTENSKRDGLSKSPDFF